VANVPIEAQNIKVPSFLRQGIDIDQKTLEYAVALHASGWRYTMPKPKNAEAKWGNYDQTTEWWYGYWCNEKTNQYSNTTPVLKDGRYIGDNQYYRACWRTGGAPKSPT